MSLEKRIQDAVEDKLQKRIRQKTRQRAISVFKECCVMTRSFIEDFYAAYTPQKYERWESFYDTPQVVLTKRSDSHYQIEMRFIDSLNGLHHDSDEYIYGRVIYHGIHGTQKICQSTSIEDMFYGWLDKRFVRR